MDVSSLKDLPAEYGRDLGDEIRAAVAASGRKLVALDDDPTGVQTVHGTPVLAGWGEAALAAELRQPQPVCFLLTNSRSLPEAEAVALNREIGQNLAAAAAATGVGVVVASRSDSTLRGHFPAETDALAETLGPVDGVLVVPAFFEGGRLTVGDVHYVREGERLVPAAETEFAQDATFGYRSSDLRAWVAEKSGGRVAADEVGSLGLAGIRAGGPEWVERELRGVGGGRPVVVNAAAYRDLEVVALGVLRAEAAGKRFLYRTGASFVRVRAGLEPRALLGREELVGAGAPAPLPGVVVVGSHVRRSGEQLARLLDLPGTAAVELSVPGVLDGATRAAEIERVRGAATAALGRGETPVIFTSRQVRGAADAAARLAVGRSVSAALVEAVGGLPVGAGGPGWVVGKGGITSSDVGTEALGMRRAIVLGQIRPGIPVWRLGPETRYPGLPYVVFPGNVGEAGTLAEVVAVLRGGAG